MKTALVTGAAGFIGMNLCAALLSRGYAVIALDSFITSTDEHVKQFQDNIHFRFFTHDVTVPIPVTISRQFSDIGEIYHLACPTGVPNIELFGEEMITASSVGTIQMLELAKKTGAKFLYASSSEVYGDPLVSPQTESYTGNVDPLGPRSPYEEGKRFGETLVKLYVNKYNVQGKIVRIFNTYGPFMSKSDSRVIPNFLEKLKNNEALTVQGDGLQSRTFCYIDDLISGILLVLEKGISGEAYNAGSDQSITIQALAEKMCTISAKRVPIRRIQRPYHDHQQRMPALEKIKALGWMQTVSLDEGLKRTLLWSGL
jgi:nucleoside-diphosphate-sugar epimerase